MHTITPLMFMSDQLYQLWFYIKHLLFTFESESDLTGNITFKVKFVTQNDLDHIWASYKSP